MQYEIRYDVVSVILLILLYILNKIYFYFPTRTNKIFRVFTFDVMMTAFLDVFTAFTNMYTNTPLLLVINNILAVIHIICSNSMAPLYYLYILSITNEFQVISGKKVVLPAILYPLILIIIITSPFTHFVMYYNEQGVYSHGFGMTLMYIISFIYLLGGSFVLMKNVHRISKKQLISVFSYTVIMFATALYQFMNPKILMIGLGTALSLFIISYTLKNPMELKDIITGLYNRNAFKENFFTIRGVRDNCTLCFVHLKDAEEIRYKYGVDTGYVLIKKSYAYLVEKCRLGTTFYIFSDTIAFLAADEKEAELKLNQILSYKKNPMKLKKKDDPNEAVDLYFNSDVYYIRNLKDLELTEFEKNSSDKIETLLQFMKFIVDNYSNGSAITFVDKKIIEEYAMRLYIRNEVSKAIENETFEVFLQPIFDLKAKRFTGAESLIRLRDSNGKYIPPGLFIHEAEKNGQILALGDISIKKTCEFIINGKLQELDIQKVNINLSMIQCMQDNIAEHLISLLDQYSIPKKMIRFEITETVIATKPDKLSQVMQKLSEEGIEFALDDYGTGYSNTSRLLSFPFSEIKFDKSFVDSAIEDKKNSVPLKHLMNMVRESNMIVLVEGVETKEMAEMIDAFGGNLIQGFYYAKPLPLNDFVSFVKGN